MDETWSYRDSLGDTIMEKYESFYVRLHEVFGSEHGPYLPPDWIICGDDVSRIFTSSSTGMTAREEECKDHAFYKLGRINDKFEVYVDRGLKDTVYVGRERAVRRLLVTDLII